MSSHTKGQQKNTNSDQPCVFKLNCHFETRQKRSGAVQFGTRKLSSVDLPQNQSASDP